MLKRVSTVAGVVRGVPPYPLRTLFQDALESIHRQFGPELQAFQGDSAPFERTRSSGTRWNTSRGPSSAAWRSSSEISLRETCRVRLPLMVASADFTRATRERRPGKARISAQG